MVRDYGVDPDKVAVVGAGANLDVDAERDGIDKDFSQQNILFVGLEPERKGLPILEQAFARVRERFPNARLHVAGVSGAGSPGVVYHGVVRGEPLKKLFYDAQVFALPSYREPFGIVFLEAMRAKTACIGTNLAAMPEIIEDGKTGCIVEPGNADMLAAKLIDLFDDPQRLKAMAENGYRAAQQRFGWDRAASIVTGCLLEGAPVESRAAGPAEFATG
jgi:glycosyltransferase involved in cell wall biosynthesis